MKISVGKSIRASITVEAALVMPMVLVVMLLSIRWGCRMHDLALGNIAAVEVAELLQHAPAEAAELILPYEREKLKAGLSGRPQDIFLDMSGDRYTVRVEYEGRERSMSAGQFHPQHTMRQLCITEALQNP